jgi:hypothetical protein
MKNLNIKKILQIINKADPLGLFVDNETNFNEFLGEATEIKKRINSLSNGDLNIFKVKNIVDDVFHSSFEGVEIKQIELDEIKEKLYQELKNN